MKYVYVVNLDSKRILSLSGILCLLLGTFLWIGIKLGKSRYSNQFGATSLELELDNTNADQTDWNLPVPDSASSQVKLFDPTQLSNKVNEPAASSPIPSIGLSELEEAGVELDVRMKDPIQIEDKIPTKPQIRQRTNPRVSPKVFYTIQMGAFRHEKDAKRFVKILSEKGVQARIDRGIRFYYVRVDKSSRRESLKLKKLKLARDFSIEPLILKVGS